MKSVRAAIVQTSDREATLATNLGAARKPPRLNFAGACMWCGERDCRSPRCINLHVRSRWVVCDECGGESFCLCTCVFGVMEA